MGHSVNTEDNKSRAVTTGAAAIFALIIVGLLIGTANFIQAMSGGDHGHHGTEATHDTHAAHEEHHDHAHAPSQGQTAPESETPPSTTPAEHAEAGHSDETH